MPFTAAFMLFIGLAPCTGNPEAHCMMYPVGCALLRAAACAVSLYLALLTVTESR